MDVPRLDLRCHHPARDFAAGESTRRDDFPCSPDHVFFPRGRKTAIPTLAIGLDTALVQMHCDTPGASIYFTKDGSIPSGRSVLELYTGAFRLRPGKWQLTAIAKRKDWERSEVARSADLDCRFEEDRSGVFCEPQGPDPSAPGLTANGNNVGSVFPIPFFPLHDRSPLIKEDGALSSSNFSTHGCTFPAGKTLREVWHVAYILSHVQSPAPSICARLPPIQRSAEVHASGDTDARCADAGFAQRELRTQVRDVFQEKNLTLFKVEETWCPPLSASARTMRCPDLTKRLLFLGTEKSLWIRSPQGQLRYLPTRPLCDVWN
eukprot:3329242-Rhodomonas_salina.2